MFEFAQQQNKSLNRHSVSPGRLDHANSRHAPSARNSYLTQQSAWGNQALHRMLCARSIQAKLTVNQPGDRYEQEADRVAEQVMRMPNQALPQISNEVTTIRRECSACESSGDSCSGCAGEVEKPEIQTKGEDCKTPSLPSVEASQIQALRGGQPLPSSSRAFFETRFGRDFSAVRLHTGQMATNAANTINAKAFTFGQDIVFGAGYYSPETSAGHMLMAHELTHVIQQQRLSTEGQLLQRQGVDTDEDIDEDIEKDVDDSGPDLVTTGGDTAPAPAQQNVSFGPGLPQPDCSTHVRDIYELHGTITSTNQACSVAGLKDRHNGSTILKVYRADQQFAGNDPCPGFPGVVNLSFWLDNERRVVEINRFNLTIMNACGDEEVLEAGGRVFGDREILEIVKRETPVSTTEMDILENPASIDPELNPEVEFGPQLEHKEGSEIDGHKGDAFQYEDGTIQIYPEGSTGSITYKPRPDSIGAYDVYDQDGNKVENLISMQDPDEIFSGP